MNRSHCLGFEADIFSSFSLCRQLEQQKDFVQIVPQRCFLITAAFQELQLNQLEVKHAASANVGYDSQAGVAQPIVNQTMGFEPKQ